DRANGGGRQAGTLAAVRSGGIAAEGIEAAAQFGDAPDLGEPEVALGVLRDLVNGLAQEAVWLTVARTRLSIWRNPLESRSFTPHPKALIKTFDDAGDHRSHRLSRRGLGPRFTVP